VSVSGQQPGYWINSHSATVNFVSTPPAVASQNNFIASPIQSLTYGISSTSNVPPPDPPVSSDIILPNSACPAPGDANPPLAAVFKPAAQNVIFQEDGQYLLHYLAQDCAGTEELKFTQDGTGSWSTSFYTYPVNVDTVAPVVLSGPTLSPAPTTNGTVPNSYLLGQPVTATYRCTDDRSGITKCGASTFGPGTTLDTNNLMSSVDTSKAGPATFTVLAVDAAGNQTSASVNYQVVAGTPVNLYITKLATPRVKPKSQAIYLISVANLGKSVASSVTVTDPLPQGVTFERANALQITCTKNHCSNTASCKFANNTVSCTTASLSLLSPLTIEIDVSVQAPVGTTITNTATVSSTNVEGSPGRLQSSASTVVVAK
jgi:uncharacterized repeat protein (TIGR01451 family)